jgi:two-component system chemotaxis response regulator CheY
MLPKILIIDDALFMRTMIRDILANSGKFEIAGEASNGMEGIEKYFALKPDVVTMDIVMPELDGIETVRRITKVDPGARIIMCSALGQEPLVMESLAAGARNFIVKPFNPERVIEAIEDVLRD